MCGNAVTRKSKTFLSGELFLLVLVNNYVIVGSISYLRKIGNQKSRNINIYIESKLKIYCETVLICK